MPIKNYPTPRPKPKTLKIKSSNESSAARHQSFHNSGTKNPNLHTSSLADNKSTAHALPSFPHSFSIHVDSLHLNVCNIPPIHMKLLPARDSFCAYAQNWSLAQKSCRSSHKITRLVMKRAYDLTAT